MDNYFTFTQLLGIRDQNLPLSREKRLERLQSVKKMVDLVTIARNLFPKVPERALKLDQFDAEWDDKMPFPVVDRRKYMSYGFSISTLLFFYSYNYNTFTHNIRYRTFRNMFPVMIALLFGKAYSDYKKQILKINLFDEYCWIRSQELIKQNEYLLQHEDFKKSIWFAEDFKETMGKVHRQANNHHASDFKDSELIIQDFINRYVDVNSESPMKAHTTLCGLE